MRAVYKAVFRRRNRTERIVYFTAPQDEELVLMASAALINESVPAKEALTAKLIELYQVDQVEE